MILTVASYKGGVGKTTTAVHLAAYLNSLAPACLLDGDSTRNAAAWSEREPDAGGGFPFPVAPIEHLGKMARIYPHLVVDTGQRPSEDDLQAAAGGCDLLIVPAVPAALDTDGLGQTVRALEKIPRAKYRVLITKVAQHSAADVMGLRELLAGIQAPVFRTEIPLLKAFDKAAGSGRLVRDADDKQAARAWEAYVAAGKELQA